MKKLVIIDGKSVFYRGYYAMSGLSTVDGTPTGGVYGFVSLAFEVISKLKPDYVAVAWDKKGTSTERRTALYPDYKAGRKTAPDDFYAQIPILHDFLSALGWPLFECDGYEADDILGTLSEQANKLGIESNLITSDLDMLQLIDHDTKVFAMKKGFSQIEEYDLAYFEQKYGLKQSQFLDLKALQGDSSDNIPGVAGIGPKTATKLLQEFNTLEEVYENLDKIKPSIRSKLEAEKEMAFLSRKLATIWTDAPVELNLEQADIKNFSYQKVLEMIRKLEFNSLIRKIPTEMRDSQTTDSNQISIFSEVNGEKSQDINKIPKMKELSGNPNNLTTNENLIFISTSKDKVFLSNRENFLSVDFSKFDTSNLNGKKIVFFDAKNCLHHLEKNNISLLKSDIYDLKQMEFLINPLIRDKSISGILGVDIDEFKPPEKMGAMVKIYNQQQEKLKNLPKIRKIAEDFDFKLIPVLLKIEQQGVQICPDFFTRTSTEFNDKILQIEDEIFKMVGHNFNIASPLQLSKILFEVLNLPTKGIKKSKTGFSTGQKELDKLRNLHPIIEKIEEFREYSKLKNTYVDALPKLADKNNRIHSTFNQDITSTGRLSSSNPNLQNIPIRTELGRKIRAGFIAKKDHVLISADYSQFELRLAAVLSGDLKMIEDFNNDVDIHQKTASEMFKMPLDQVTSDQRRAAKTINFGVLYGMSAHRLANELGTSFAEAKNFIENYFEVRQPIQKYIERTIFQAENDGFVETFYGRRRPTPDIKSSNFMIREAAKRAAANMPIQGTEADLMKRAMIKIDEKIVQAGLGEQILQIHDSILIEAPKENAEKIAEILKVEMENVAPELEIPLKVDVKIGESWEEI